MNKLEQIRWPPALRGPKYLRRTLYLDESLAYQLRELAKTESWELADLARGMIMVGLTMRNLHETESKVSSTQRLIQAVDALNYFAHGAVGCRYSERGGGRGVWVTVSLPAGFVKHVDLYASGHGRSHNDALNMFLQDGLLCYMFGYSHFLKGAIAARDHEAAGSQGLGDKKIKSSLAVIFMKFSQRPLIGSRKLGT